MVRSRIRPTYHGPDDDHVGHRETRYTLCGQSHLLRGSVRNPSGDPDIDTHRQTTNQFDLALLQAFGEMQCRSTSYLDCSRHSAVDTVNIEGLLIVAVDRDDFAARVVGVQEVRLIRKFDLCRIGNCETVVDLILVGCAVNPRLDRCKVPFLALDKPHHFVLQRRLLFSSCILTGLCEISSLATMTEGKGEWLTVASSFCTSATTAYCALEKWRLRED